MPDGPAHPDRDRPPRPPAGGRNGTSGAEFAGVGLQFAGSILLFLWLGQWADAKLGTSPAGVLVGVFTGAGGAFYAMYRKLTAAERAEDARKRP